MWATYVDMVDDHRTVKRQGLLDNNGEHIDILFEVHHGVYGVSAATRRERLLTYDGNGGVWSNIFLAA